MKIKEVAVLITTLVLTVAFLHEKWDTLIKISGERLLVIACMHAVALLLVVALVEFLTFPLMKIWPWILASVVFKLICQVLSIRAYRRSDLGLICLLMRGLLPLVVLELILTSAGEVLM